MSGFGYSDWSYDPFEKLVIFPPDPLAIIDGGTFRALVVCENFNPKIDPLLSSSMGQAA